MKTNPAARRIVKTRVAILFLSFAAAMAADLILGESLVARFGQVTALKTDELQVPNLSLGDVLAAIH